MDAGSSESPNMGSNKTIVWFRRDLRIEDNPALTAAARDGFVYPVYIWCPKEEGQFYPGRVSRWWLKQSLAHLKQSLKSLGADLVLMKTRSTIFSLLECINATGATKVAFNSLYGMHVSFLVFIFYFCLQFDGIFKYDTPNALIYFIMCII